MACNLLLLWFLSTIALWVFAVRGFREVAAAVDQDRQGPLTAAILLAAVPPTLVFLMSAFVLLQAAPTAQLNAGSPRAMDLWSLWVGWYPALFGCSGLQTLVYLLWAVVSFLMKQRASLRYAVVCGFISSVWGSLLLSMAYPTA
jgi:hypothetical protein